MRISKIRNSRADWKKKAKARGSKIRNLKKTSKRQKARVDNAQDKEEIRRLKEEMEKLRSKLSAPVPQMQSSPVIEQRSLCVLIVIFGIVSFRSVPRILHIFQPFLRGKLQIPHFTSVIHWALRVGIAIFNQVSMIQGPWVTLIDCSIDVGTRKALVVLRIPLSALQKKQGAVGLEDCECIGLEVSHKWNGQLVFEALTRVFKTAGLPVAVIKDGGTDLNKGVEMFCEQHPDQKIHIIDDIGHFAANALKALFAKTKPFKTFLEIISSGSKRIRQTKLAWLLPPKIRTKGRFQGITAVAEWAKTILDLIGGKGKAKDGSDLSQARKAFAGLAKLRPFLTMFCHACAIVEDFLRLMKTEGLNQATYTRARNILKKLPTKSLVRKRLSAWLTKHIGIHRALGIGNLPLLVSSDAIESLFGKFKTIIQRNPQSELNRLLYIIPLLCGNHSHDAIHAALQECSHIQMRRQIEQTIPPTLRQQRVRELGKNSNLVPNNGDFQWREAG